MLQLQAFLFVFPHTYHSFPSSFPKPLLNFLASHPSFTPLFFHKFLSIMHNEKSPRRVLLCHISFPPSLIPHPRSDEGTPHHFAQLRHLFTLLQEMLSHSQSVLPHPPLHLPPPQLTSAGNACHLLFHSDSFEAPRRS